MSSGIFNHNYLIWLGDKIYLEWRKRHDIVFWRYLKTKKIKNLYILVTRWV
ncbi:Uncharacterised protein [Serratia plymuthica]|nr:Uncharacterised protein [Serratia plymuthica]